MRRYNILAVFAVIILGLVSYDPAPRVIDVVAMVETGGELIVLNTDSDATFSQAVQWYALEAWDTQPLAHIYGIDSMVNQTLSAQVTDLVAVAPLTLIAQNKDNVFEYELAKLGCGYNTQITKIIHWQHLVTDLVG